MTSRQAIRQRMRAQRRALSAEQQLEHAAALADRLVRHRLFLSSRHIALYLPVDGEIDPLLIMERAWRMGKATYLPILAPCHENRLWFARYRPGDRLESNRFGIPEPARGGRRVSLLKLNLVLTPLVGFDGGGHRIGMGGAYYDRSFAFLRRRSVWRRPRLIGLAHEFQRLPHVAPQPWDVPLTAVATEQHLYLR